MLGLLRRRRGPGLRGAPPGPRGGGRSRAEIIRHTRGAELYPWSRKVGVRTDMDDIRTPAGLAAHQHAYLEAIRAYNAESKLANTWPIHSSIRRTAQHVMDHAWEMEDRDLTGG